MGEPGSRRAWLERLLRAGEALAGRPRVARVRAVLDRYAVADGGLLAAGIAYNAVFAIIPVGIFVSGILGFLLSDPTNQVPVLVALANWAPPLAGVLDEIVIGLTSASPSLSVIGLIGAAWGTSRLFASLESAIGDMFAGVPRRGMLVRTARRVGSVVVLGAIVAVTLFAAPGLAFVAELVGPVSPAVAVVLSAALLSVPLGLTFAALVAVYLVIPPIRPPWRGVVVPAAVGAIAIVILPRLFAIAAPRLLGANFVYGTLGALFVGLAWLQLVFMVILLGAAWVRERTMEPAPSPPSEPSRPG